MKMSKEENENMIFNMKYQELPRYYVRVVYADNSEKLFDNEEWDVLKAGIKANLYDQNLIKELSMEKEDV